MFDGKRCRLFKPRNEELVDVSTRSSSNMFPLCLSNLGTFSLKEDSVMTTQLWHERFGHLNLKSLYYLSKRNMIHGLPKVLKSDNIFCEACVLGKQHRQQFPKMKSWRADVPLQLVYSDICGPMSVPSLNKNLYFLLFVDDATQMSWVFFLREKSEAFKNFVKFKALAKNQSRCTLKILRTDRGGEFTSRQFDSFCNTHGIQHKLTVPYTLQQNGVSKRKNRAIIKKATCLLNGRGLPKFL